MSLRIKIPPKSVSSRSASLSPSQYAHSEPALLRRKSAKRRATDTDGSAITEDAYAQVKTHVGGSYVDGPPLKRARMAEADEGDLDTDMDVDIGVEADVYADEDMGMIEAETAPPSSKKAKIAVSKASKRIPIPSKKKRAAVIYSDDEDEQPAYAPEENTAVDDEDDNFESGLSAKRPAGPVRQKSAGPPRAKISKGKGKAGKEKEIKDILMKDERKMSQMSRLGSTTAEGNAAPKRPAPKEHVTHTDDIDIVSDSPAPPPADEQPALEPVPKKRKLPTIKKTKTPGSAGSITPAPKPSPAESPEIIKPVPVSARKPAATVGNADFDLRKPSVYAELFKNAGGSTPRSGLNRREKEEERRKELNRMRDEARAKRAIAAKDSFDLQAQWDKIARFEDRLRREQRPPLYPNILAAKFKQEWERERERERRAEKWVRQDEGEIAT